MYTIFILIFVYLRHYAPVIMKTSPPPLSLHSQKQPEQGDRDVTLEQYRRAKKVIHHYVKYDDWRG